MLELHNSTPFAAALVPGLDRRGRGIVTVVVKGTFALGRTSDALPAAQAQVPIAHADTWHGKPGASSIRYESDLCPAKPGTDVLLVGHAYAPSAGATSADVAVEVGPIRKVVRAFGERHYQTAVGGAALSKPQPFERVPLLYERAFGGVDTSDDDPRNHAADRRNPVGTGFVAAPESNRFEGRPAPNLEAPRQLIRGPGDRPPPAAFGVIGRDWLPRAAHAGSYDERWRRERCPLLPDDFDERYFQTAAPDQVATPHLRGNERMRVSGATPHGELGFALPGVALDVSLRLKGAALRHRPVLDTLLVEPDERRAVLTWRLTVPCGRDFLHLDWVKVAMP